MTAQDLKNAILQQAIQGKLLLQNPADEPASELLKEISAERQKLIDEGKIKNPPQLPPIADDEKLFDIPESWQWCRLIDLGNFSSGKTPNMYEKNFWENGAVQWFTAKDMKTKFLTESKMKITDEAAQDMRFYKEGTLLLVVRSGILKKMLPVCILKTEGTINQDIKAYSLYNLATSDYLYYMLKGLETSILKNYTKRITTVDSLKFEEFSKDMPVPLPPLAEQKRIVEKLEEILPLVERYGELEQRLTKLDKEFPDKLKKSLLQQAIQGKLTEQLTTDGDAKDLLEKIRAEKSKLISEGKIKKEKLLPPISAEEIPFDIPENWQWVRLGEIVSVLGDGIHGTPEYDLEGKFYFINGNNLSNGKIFIKSDTKRVNQSEYEKYKKFLDDTSILVSINGTLGNVAFYENEKIILGKSACYFNLMGKISKHFIKILLSSKFFLSYANEKATGSTIKNVSLKAMKNFIVPLPPLAEQKRIVERLEELLPLCDRLKGKFTEVQ